MGTAAVTADSKRQPFLWTASWQVSGLGVVQCLGLLDWPLLRLG